MIETIKLDKNFEEYVTISGLNELSNLTRINVFVGANNSGKSRMLRTLFANDFSFQDSSFDHEGHGNLVRRIKQDVTYFFGERHIDQYNLGDQIYAIPEATFIENGQLSSKATISTLENYCKRIPSSGYGSVARATLANIQSIISKVLPEIREKTSSFQEENAKFKRIYIPVLRGLKPIQIKNNNSDFDTTKDNYLSRTHFDYFKSLENNGRKTINTGLDLYDLSMHLLLGDTDSRKKIRQFEIFLSKNFFNEADINIVPRIKEDKVIHIKIGKEERAVYDLGDGIQAIIALTYPLFFNVGSKMVFFIEEPETHLHPGLQRILIETLFREEFSEFQYFITTHSNHFLDLTVEFDNISVYTFKKNTENSTTPFTIENVNSNDKQILELLGIRNSSVFLSNCTIWVEGITDRLYLRKYIEVVSKQDGKKFREDFDYAFIEYAGSNITHWSFLENEDDEHPNINYEAICSKIFLLADSDGIELSSKPSETKKERRLSELQQKLGDHFYATHCREVENLLTKDVIRSVVKEYEGKNSEKLDFTDFDVQDHTKNYIGDFIQKTVKNIKRTYRNEYGTIKNKVDFCKKAISKINTIDDLSDEAINLTGKIIAFIESNRK